MILHLISSAISLAGTPLYGLEQAPPSSAGLLSAHGQLPALTPLTPDMPTLVEQLQSGTATSSLPVPPIPDQQRLSDLRLMEMQDSGNDSEDIIVSGRKRLRTDPLERANIQSYRAVQAIDGAIVAPLAKGYKRALPKPVRDGIHNFLDNVQEPIVFLNYLLQLKPGKAIETLGRFVVNTTVGLAGVVDIAKRCPINLPHRPNSLANTLGYYGVKPGPYLFLPLIGPTTVRDLFGTSLDRLALPATIGTPFNKPYYTITTNVLSALDYRVAFDEKLTELHSAQDPYVASRTAYLQRRKAEIDRLHSPSWNARHAAAQPLAPTIPKSLGNCRRSSPR